jgi:rubredoxin
MPSGEGGKYRRCAGCGDVYDDEAVEILREWGEEFEAGPGRFLCPDCLAKERRAAPGGLVDRLLAKLAENRTSAKEKGRYEN